MLLRSQEDNDKNYTYFQVLVLQYSVHCTLPTTGTTRTLRYVCLSKCVARRILIEIYYQKGFSAKFLVREDFIL